MVEGLEFRVSGLGFRDCDSRELGFRYAHLNTKALLVTPRVPLSAVALDASVR